MSKRATARETNRVDTIDTPIFLPMSLTRKLSEKINGKPFRMISKQILKVLWNCTI
jgi:hypothetical protein